MSPLAFCMVTTFYPPYNVGGDGIAIRNLARALVRAGHAVTVLQDVDGYRVLAGGAEPAPSPDDGVEAIRLRSRAPLVSTLLTQQAGRPVVQGRAIRGFLESRRFDVINFHNVSLVGGPGVLSAGDAVKLYTAHEHWLVCPTHVLWRFGREPCTGKRCVRCTLSYGRPPQLWRYTGLLERNLVHVDAFIAMSEFSRAKHREFGFPRDMEVVNPGLPERASAPPGESPHARPFYFFAGRLERIKGLDDVIPLFAGATGPDLVVAGEGKHEPALRRLATGSGRVRFLGRVEPAVLERYYAHALALLVPSVGFETFGLVIIEAFRHGTPVLARRIGPFPEIVGRAGGGAVFEGPAELAEAMARLERDPALRSRWSGEALRAFREHWTEEAMLSRYLAVVERAARAKGRVAVAEAVAR